MITKLSINYKRNLGEKEEGWYEMGTPLEVFSRLMTILLVPVPKIKVKESKLNAMNELLMFYYYRSANKYIRSYFIHIITL